jgi:hypothetical protein
MEGAAVANGELSTAGEPAMSTKHIFYTLAVALSATGAALAQSSAGDSVPVTVDNFTRAESDLYFGGLIKDSGGIGKFLHPSKNDGATFYQLIVKDVPVNGFWSVSVYNAAGYYERNPYNAYTLNNLTAAKSNDGAIAIQFGGCDGKVANCLPITTGWNYTVRLYQPRAEILNGTWTFPQARPLP